jgi:dihydroneopterin triphosphate diphosphatase
LTDIVSKYIECYVYKKFDDGIKYLLLKRSESKQPFPGIWQIVTGKMEEEEKAYNTAIREVMEETSLKPVKCYVAPKINGFYTPHNDNIYLIPVFVICVDDERIVLSDEHVQYEWLDFKNAYNRIHWYSQKENLKIIDDLLTGKIKNTMIEISLSF